MGDGGSTRARRATRAVVAGRVHATAVAHRLGVALREAREAAGVTQAEVAARTGISQPMVSRLERGLGASSTIQTWAAVTASLDERLAVYVERVPGADRPRDFEHLRRQQLLIELSKVGGWIARFEEPLDRGRTLSRSVDLVLRRPPRREVVVVEVWDWLDDIGEAVRATDAKAAQVARQIAAERRPGEAAWWVTGLWVLRGTRRNRGLVDEFRAVFETRFPASRHAWLAALTRPDRPMPATPGLLWTDVRGRHVLVHGTASGRQAPDHRRPGGNGPTD
jgi:transcriptional regulator with XRE-family HTH domain